MSRNKSKNNPKLLCIYLPQYHRISENDEWWGEGFTEWTNVRRGYPFYPGHYQPRVPLFQDYYDLSDVSVLNRHTKMAAWAGIYGFVFYHYYFKGRKLLEQPIESYRDDAREVFPYCLAWANQSWTRTWYRAKIGDSTLLKQDYGEEGDWRRHFEYLLTYFRDERYIKVENRPMYLIYRPQDIDCRRKMFSLWDTLAKNNGFAGMYLIAMNTINYDRAQNLYGAYMNFEPIHTFYGDKSWRFFVDAERLRKIDRIKLHETSIWNYFYSRNTYSYAYLCREIEKGNFIASCKKTYLGAFAGWDNTSRKDQEGFIIRNSTPHRFKKHIKKMIEVSRDNGCEFLFLNAWNEWSEGAYIEPDEHYHDGYLRALKEAMAS